MVPLKPTARISGWVSSSRSIAFGRSRRIEESALASRSPSSHTSQRAIRWAATKASLSG